MSERWWIYAPPGGPVEQVISASNPLSGDNPAYDWDPAYMQEVSRKGNLGIEKWENNSWVLELDKVVVAATRKIDLLRESSLAEVISSPSINQVKQHKKNEAREYLLREGSQEPPAGLFPWLANEASERNITLHAMAELIIAAAEEEEVLTTKIDTDAVLAKKAIREAGSLESINQVLTSFNLQPIQREE